MKLQEKYKELRNKPQALLATNFYNFETLNGILKAAAVIKSPIIIQLTESSIQYMGLPVAFKLAKSVIQYYGVEAWIHLDHGDSYELAAKCLDAGFDSVMIDASEKPFRQNVEITRKVVELAAKYGVCVEAELGYVAKLGQSTEKRGFTEPKEANAFASFGSVKPLFSVDCPNFATYPSSASTQTPYFAASSTTFRVISTFCLNGFSLASIITESKPASRHFAANSYESPWSR